jgi:hypothetical protein
MAAFAQRIPPNMAVGPPNMEVSTIKAKSPDKKKI